MKKTPLNEIHYELGAKMTDFGGWDMPIEYSGIIEEHHAVRNACGLFDVSHMGEIKISGDNALEAVQRLITNDAARLSVGDILYSPMCRENGGIIDDLLVYRTGEESFLLVVNASNQIKDFNWIENNLLEGAVAEDLSDNYAMVAVQGPESKKLLKNITDLPLDDLAYYHFFTGKVADKEVILSRTGYTGELGYEIYFNPSDANHIWHKIMEAGKEYDLKPAGLGARDTLRLEKMFCLYGNDIDETTHPLEAGLGWTVQYNKDNFIGQKAICKFHDHGFERRLVGFKITGRGIARHDYEVFAKGEKIGSVTSGTHSPSLGKSIGLAYVKKEFAKTGAEIEIKIRNRMVAAEVVLKPFV